MKSRVESLTAKKEGLEVTFSNENESVSSLFERVLLSVGRNAGELISEMVLALEMGAETGDVAASIHPHPTLSETLGLAAEVLEKTVTDL